MSAAITSNYTSGSGTLSFPPNTILCQINQMIGGGGGGGGGALSVCSGFSFDEGGPGGAQGGTFTGLFAVNGGNFSYSIGTPGVGQIYYFRNGSCQIVSPIGPESTNGGNTTFGYTNNSININCSGGGRGSGWGQQTPAIGGSVSSSGTFINSTPTQGANGATNNGSVPGAGGGVSSAYGSGGNGGPPSISSSGNGLPGIGGYLSLTFLIGFPGPPVSLISVQNYYGSGLRSSVGRRLIDSAGNITTIPASVSLSNFGGKYPVLTIVTTFAGSGYPAFADGIGTAASFNSPSVICIDSAGVLYVADSLNQRIRRIATNGMVTTIAGSGTAGFADGIGAAASFYNPNGICVDSAGILYVADTFNQRIRRIATNGMVTTIAGSGIAGFADGIGAAASFWNPTSICVDSTGVLYVADVINNRIRRITMNGSVDTFAGNGSPSFVDGIGTAAGFYNPSGICIDSAGVLYVADSSNQIIRRITTNASVTTIAGSGIAGFADGIGAAASFNIPWEICIDSAGILYVADMFNYKIRRIATNGMVTTIAGSGKGFADGIGAAAMFALPKGICIDSSGILYIGDGENNRIRKIS